MDIAKIDPNMAVKSTVKDDAVMLDPRNFEKFDFYGLYNPRENTEHYRRIPETEELKNATNCTGFLNYCPAGGRIRFSTDSEYIGVSVEVDGTGTVINNSKIGRMGLDLYIDTERGSSFAGIFKPAAETNTLVENIIDLSDIKHSVFRKEKGKMYFYTIGLPTLEATKSIKIILQKDSKLGHGIKYRNQKPIVYYGSSITQGIASPKPGGTYQAIISRRLNSDYINLGFSGNTKGEKEMMENIAFLDMEAFVYDYDHNAPDVEHLEKTHKRGYEIVREKHPDIPIIMISKPDFRTSIISSSYNNEKRRDVIYKTYIDALNSGDKNIYFMDGAEFFNFDEGDLATSDLCHPNALGFYVMAEKIGNLLKKVLLF